MERYRKHNSLVPSSNIKEYIQETRHAGCDNLPAKGLLVIAQVRGGWEGIYTCHSIETYMENNVLHVEIFFSKHYEIEQKTNKC